MSNEIPQALYWFHRNIDRFCPPVPALIWLVFLSTSVCHFAEETFNQVEPGCMLWYKHKYVTSFWLCSQIILHFLCFVCRMVVTDNPDNIPFQIHFIKFLQKTDEIGTFVSFTYNRNSYSCEKINSRPLKTMCQGVYIHSHDIHSRFLPSDGGHHLLLQ